MHAVVLVIHVVAGSLGLLVGPAAMLAPKRAGRHPLLGRSYQVLTGALCLSAFGLVAYRPSLWWLGVIGALTWAAALAGWWVRRAAFRGWVVWHINLMCSSYISFVTAFLVVNLGLGSPVAWILPTAVGTPLIARATVRALRAPAPRSAQPPREVPTP
ncbi:hypothetical protein SAMN05216223_120151 [Actinacidiphila yanglinensis]|uniref:DUF2306 domain-containing protein n=1 Tax=Actinacidiphila yanglinensis TaxID=310779 RepID=A0A1H6DWK2_9ACTN|nr:hypothetical protein [Actinacidiphila yanglinensis]SEG89641.1 hypothetical protein SAMN05216223_120151 [Actinacidiphila yanglinensis]